MGYFFLGGWDTFFLLRALEGRKEGRRRRSKEGRKEDSFSLGLLGFYVLYWVFELSDPSTCWWPIASTFVGSSTVHSWFEVDCSREAQG